MWAFLPAIKLIRYLVVWRVNRSMVRVPRCLTPELALTLGQIIARRLPTQEARAWRKALTPALPTDPNSSQTTAAPWPVEAAVVVYPGKQVYGQGEVLLWELKLFGESADHGLFLEVFLPAMEEAGYSAQLPGSGRNSLWGHFDVRAVYAASGSGWEPLVREGRLDLRYRASAVQWANGLDWGDTPRRPFRRLTWVTPFDLEGFFGEEEAGASGPLEAAPILYSILEALAARLGALVPGHQPWSSAEQAYLERALEQAYQTPVHSQKLRKVPPQCPGRWQGTHLFASIPAPLLPYLQLASTVQVGRQIHFGCGTFALGR